MVYVSDHYFYKARDKVGNLEKKISTLHKALRWDPFNDRVLHELGKTYYHLSLENLTDEEKRNSSFQKTLTHLIRAIRLNPGAYKNHFYLAQTLFRMRFFSSLEWDYFDEYKKAALLTTYDRNVYFEVGKILLSQWPKLSDENKEFTLRLIKSILDRRDRERIQTMFQVWSDSGAEYGVIDEILPQTPDVFRLYARYLGEKSLSLSERQTKLAQAEYMEYERAKNSFRQGQQDYRLYRVKKAKSSFWSCLRALQNIYFYQDLTHQDLIDRNEYNTLIKSCYLALIRCDVETGQNIPEIRKNLCSYLKLETDTGKVNEIESYLMQKGFLKRETSLEIDDAERLLCRVAIDFAQHRYRDIIRVGERFKQNFIFQGSKNRDYIEIFQMIGDSYQRTDFLYDADVFYQKALEIDSKNIETLIKIFNNYERLNDEEGKERIEKRIDQVILPRVSVFNEMKIQKGKMISIPVILKGDEIDAVFAFTRQHPAPLSLITVIFNGRILSEKYIEGNSITVSVSPVLGSNVFKILPVNGTITLVNLIIEPK
jgi:hypothetical protein